MSRHARPQPARQPGHESGRLGGWQRTAAAVRGVTALVVLAGLLVGVPLLLLALQADPLPDHLPAWHDLIDRARELVTRPDDGTLLLAVVQIVAWASWGVFALSTVVEGLAVVAGRTAPAIRGLAAVQRPAAYLVAVIAAAVTTPVASAAAAAPPPPPPTPPPPPPRTRGGAAPRRAP